MVFTNKPDLKKSKAFFAYSAIPSGKILVKEGERVSSGDVLSKGRVSIGHKEFNLTKILGVGPKEIGACLKKLPGEAIVPGDLIATRKKLFKKRDLKSSVKGVVDSLNEKTGVLRINLGESDLEAKTEVSGKVSQVKDKTIMISFEAYVFKGIGGLGGRGKGEILCLGEREEEVGFASLSSEAGGKIVVLGGRIKLDFWEKACALGVVGLLVGSVESQDFEEIKKDTAVCLEKGRRRIAVPIVWGGEKDGFISQDFFEKIKKQEGKMAEIDGAEKKLTIVI